MNDITPEDLNEARAWADNLTEYAASRVRAAGRIIQALPDEIITPGKLSAYLDDWERDQWAEDYTAEEFIQEMRQDFGITKPRKPAEIKLGTQANSDEFGVVTIAGRWAGPDGHIAVMIDDSHRVHGVSMRSVHTDTLTAPDKGDQ